MSTIVSIPTNSLSFILNGSSITDFVDGDTLEIAMPNDKTARLNGSSNSVTITDRVDGNVGTVTFNIMRYSDNDRLLTASYNRQPIEIFNGSLKEKFGVGQTFNAQGQPIGGGDGEIENWTLENGTFTSPPVHGKNNQSGQFVVTYVIEFRNAKRII